MIVLRNARDGDLEGIYQLAQKSSIGITTLPNNKALLQKNLELALESFAKKVQSPDGEYYLFVLEDTDQKRLIGTSGILALTGQDSPFYSYRLSRYCRKSPSIGIEIEYQLLHLVNDYQGRSEICTLFLDPDYRGHHLGLFLSKARFLFMAEQRGRFANDIIAQLRGYFDEKERSPFWEHVTRHFFKLEYEQADQLIMATNKQFIEDLMPQHPIYLPLLDKEAQSIIGKPHPNTVPAMQLLLQEGFRYNNYIHIFDAGPSLEAFLDDISCMKVNRVMQVSEIKDEVTGKLFMISNNTLDFRAVAEPVLLDKDKGELVISKVAAKALNVGCGDSVRLAPLQTKKVSRG